MVRAVDGPDAQRPLRLGMVGGGRGAFIGAVHRMAIRLEGEGVVLAGALSADPERARASGAEIGLAPDRCYADFAAMARAEAARDDGIEAVVIVTPNHLHAPAVRAFLDAGIDVICDKPLALDHAEAEDLVRRAEAAGLVVAVAYNNTGYPMVRRMRALVAEGALGRLRAVHLEYLQDWLARPIDAEGQKQAAWRTDPARAGASAVLADIGVHAVNLAAFATGLAVERVAAQLFTAVEGRRLDDNAHALLGWQGGVPGTLIASQTAPGHANDLTIRLIGDRAGLRWSGAAPDELRFAPLGEPTRLILRGGPGGDGTRPSRLPAGHPEGFIEAFADFYRDALALIRARREGRTSATAGLVPQVRDGADGLAFVEAAVASHAAGGVWTEVPRAR